MLRDFVICHADPYATFKDWCPFKLRAWHTHPLSGTTDCIVTLDLAGAGVREELADLEAAGVLTRLPTLTSGNAIPAAVVNHATFKAAGIVPSDRTWDAAKKLLGFLRWPPLHPEYTPTKISKTP